MQMEWLGEHLFIGQNSIKKKGVWVQSWQPNPELCKEFVARSGQQHPVGVLCKPLSLHKLLSM